MIITSVLKQKNTSGLTTQFLLYNGLLTMTKLKCIKRAVIQISEKAGYKCDDIRVSCEDGQARAGLTKTIQDYLKINQRRKMVMSTITF